MAGQELDWPWATCLTSLESWVPLYEMTPSIEPRTGGIATAELVTTGDS